MLIVSSGIKKGLKRKLRRLFCRYSLEIENDVFEHFSGHTKF